MSSQQEKTKLPRSSTQGHDYNISKSIATKTSAAISTPATSTPKGSLSTSATNTPKIFPSTSDTSTPKIFPSTSDTSPKKSKIDEMKEHYKNIRIPETFINREGSLLPLGQYDDTPNLITGIICQI